MKQRVKVSFELCYAFRNTCVFPWDNLLKGQQNHIYNRQMPYKTGVMTYRSSVDGITLGAKLSSLSTEDFEKIKDNNTGNLNATTKGFLKAISTSVKLWATLNKQQKMLDGAV